MKTLILGLLATAAITVAAQAEVTFKSKPGFVDLGISLLSRRPIEGVATNQRALITLVAEANVVAECTNPGGGSRLVTADPIEVGGFQFVPKRTIPPTGVVRMRVATLAPDTDIAGAPDCPSDKWTETIIDLQFTSAIVTVQQPVATTVLTASCAFTSPTANGIVPRVNVVCN